MPVNRSIRVLALVVALALLVPAAAAATPGDVDTPFDGHDTVAASTTPHASTAPFNVTLNYDSSAFTTAPFERDVDGTANGYTNMTGCSGSPPYWGGRSGWVRFDSAVAGTLRVDVATSGYDPILVIWNAPNSPLGSTPFTTMANQDCNAVSTSSAEFIAGLTVQANRPVHIATLGFCGRATYWTSAPGCTTGPPFDDLDARSPGGQTSVSLSFQCTNGDGDAVCDTLDPCATLSGAQGGCPDRDRDGVLDEADLCPDVAGEVNGCPPEPPVPPDLDGDGIPNASDQCPIEKGYAPSGCADGDGDGVFFPVDDCPTVKGIAPDGCRDSDGDGFSDPRDACPAVFGASANGCLEVLGATIQWQFKGAILRLKRLSVRAPEDARVEVRCSAKPKARANCPFAKKIYPARDIGSRPARSRTIDLKSRFRNRNLRARPFTLSFRVTKRGYLGTYKRYTWNGRLGPQVFERCITPAGKLEKCPR